MKLRLGILVVVPTLAMLGFAIYIAYNKSADHDAAAETRHIAQMIEVVSRVDEAIGRATALEGEYLATGSGDQSAATVNPAMQIALAEFDDVVSAHPDEWSPELIAAKNSLDEIWNSPALQPALTVDGITQLNTVRDVLLDVAAAEAARSSAASLDRRIPALFSLIRVRSAILAQTLAVSTANTQDDWTPELRNAYTAALALETSYLDRAGLILGPRVPSPAPELAAIRDDIGLGESLLSVSPLEWERTMQNWGSAINDSIAKVSRDVVVDARAAERSAARSTSLTLVAVVVTLAAALLVVLAVAVGLIRRVGRLTNFAMEIESAGRPEPLNDRHSDELGELARSLDSMAIRIDDSVKLAHLETSVLEMIAAGRPLNETLDAIGSLFATGSDDQPGQIVDGEFTNLDWTAVAASDIEKRAQLLDTQSGERSDFPESTRGRLAQSLVALALRRAHEDGVLEERATLDELTGLLNRRAIIETIDVTLDLQSDGGAMGILYVDLDEFKEINDRYGHGVGDEVLMIQARRIAALVESLGGDVGRLGGDEFLAVLPSVHDVDELMAMGKRIVEALCQRIDTSAVSLCGAASVGGAMSRFGVKADQLLHEADVALYEAKGDGKRLAVVSTPRLRRRTSEIERLKTAVRSAITHDEFCVHYQPIWRIDDGEPKLRGFEALARWDRPGADLAGPSVFMGIAEELRLMAQLDALIFRRVCTQVAAWSSRGFDDCVVSVNISPHWIEQPDFVTQVATIVAETNCDPTRLVAELTEETVMTDVEASRVRLGELGELGVRIAVDDFGQGHSSLAYLRDLPIDELKADRRFIAGVDLEPRLATIVTTIRDLARALDLRFVAEGVERKAEFDCLVEIGCDLVQGFWAGYPMTASEAANLVEQIQAGSTFHEWRDQSPHLSLQAGGSPQKGARRRMVTDGAGVGANGAGRADNRIARVGSYGDSGAGRDVADAAIAGSNQRDELLPTYRRDG